MPIVRSTKPDLEEQVPVALAARIAGIDRSSLAHLVDHGLVPTLDLGAVRSLATSGEVAAKPADDPGHLVIRLDIDPSMQRVVDMSDAQLSRAVEGPHRLPAAYRGREVLVSVRGFVIATGRLDSMGDPVALRTDRRGREIAARSISVNIERRLNDLSTRPSKAVGESRWLGRRARVGTGGAVLPLAP
ncbi:hypothetical protein [Brachybacterium sacelli]|uniref:Uncharacterized protein n=1 Tax=Brachybacterium sacelli TaxID=173364 RepID=A0ABS4X5T8_9MICO|nr:hypothetical protein [Brachybacterium sacelli]MBP2383800.1 hypothetical protein [Brachybacterium sacelli]